MMSGKGDKRRPKDVDNTTFDNNWEKTFSSENDDKKDKSNPIDINLSQEQQATFIALGNGQFIRCDGEHWHHLARLLFGGDSNGGHTS